MMLLTTHLILKRYNNTGDWQQKNEIFEKW